MPEDTDKNKPVGSSGLSRGPTVIRAAGSNAPRPPQSSASAPTIMRPTAIQQPTQSKEEAQAPTPSTPRSTATVIKSTAKPVASPITPMVSTPSAIAGEKRRGIDCSFVALSKKFSGTKPEFLTEAQRVLQHTVLSLLNLNACLRWGEDEQTQYSKLVEKSTELVGSKAQHDCARHLGRMHEVLEQISEAFDDRGSLFRRRKDPIDTYQASSQEIRQLSTVIGGLLPMITKTHGELIALAKEFVELEVTLMGSSLAARYIVEDVWGDAKQGESEYAALWDRSVSLLKTVAQVTRGSLLRHQATDNIQRLIGQIQDGILNMLPAWIEAVTTIRQQPSKTDTDLYRVKTDLGDIIAKVKGN
ncbi:hypothetical protein HZC00_00145 [Candidatus Kaiserbacteria bacterium]|nr:hypothetical protein [Candidatus Kaiserbacteria bacterium]